MRICWRFRNAVAQRFAAGHQYRFAGFPLEFRAVAQANESEI